MRNKRIVFKPDLAERRIFSPRSSNIGLMRSFVRSKILIRVNRTFTKNNEDGN